MSKRITLYRSKRQQVAGFSAREAEGQDPAAKTRNWLLRAVSLGELVPAAGDTFRAGDGVWWKVAEVGPLTAGEWPCTCEVKE